MLKCGNRNKNRANLEWKTFKLTLPMDRGIMPKELCVITHNYTFEQGYFLYKNQSSFILFAHSQLHSQAIKLRYLLQLKCL